jgi:hypothetical protein
METTLPADAQQAHQQGWDLAAQHAAAQTILDSPGLGKFGKEIGKAWYRAHTAAPVDFDMMDRAQAIQEAIQYGYLAYLKEHGLRLGDK